MSRRKRLTPQELERLCSYATPMGRCPYNRVTLVKDGARFKSRFCKAHCCKKVDGNSACLNIRTNNKGYCQHHILCTGLINDQRCTNYIKNHDPKDFKFCSQYHNCLSPGCANERNHPNGVDYRYCPDHRCDYADCANSKAAPSPFCALHTCASPACLARCPGTSGDLYDPSRYCDRHRVCAAGGCRRFAHIDDQGVPYRHCGAHLCRFEGGCDAERAPGTEDVCAAHVCEEAGCARARARRAEGSRYCKNHECEVKDCWHRRWLGAFCPQHQCARLGCEMGGEFGHYCAKHRVCATPGCDRFRSVEGENVKEMCEEHSHTRCRRPDCGARAVDGTPLCVNHICAHRTCDNERHPLSEHCAVHKCAVAGCPQLRVRVVPPRTVLMLGADGLDGAGWPLSPYCRAHACGQEACAERSVGTSGFCQAHARCRRPGCADGVDARGPDLTLCEEHNRNGPCRTVRTGVLNMDPFGYGGGGDSGGRGGGWPGLGNWGINATL